MEWNAGILVVRFELARACRKCRSRILLFRRLHHPGWRCFSYANSLKMLAGRPEMQNCFRCVVCLTQAGRCELYWSR